MARTLQEVRLGLEAVVKALKPTAIERRLLDLGLVPGTTVRAVRQSPLGDPRAYLIRGALIALRAEDAETVIVEEGTADDKRSRGARR